MINKSLIPTFGKLFFPYYSSHVYIMSHFYTEQTYVIVTHKTSMKSLPPDMNTLQKIFCSKMHPSFKYFQEVCGSK